MIHFTRTFDLLIEQFQDRDWIGIPHETFVIIVWFYILVIHFTRALAFQGHSYFMYVRVALVLLVLTQSHHVVKYKRRTLQAQMTFLLQQSRTIIVISQLFIRSRI